jgi:hypothetical protein
MPGSDFKEFVLRTLLYYDIFEHALTAEEMFTLFPRNSVTQAQFAGELEAMAARGEIVRDQGFYQLPTRPGGFATVRSRKSALARKRLRIARVMAKIMKRFPFVRGVFVSGDLSKGVAYDASDIDYVIVTAPRRLWICRTLLIFFKKVFLLNSKKFWCLNSFVTEDAMAASERNYFTATEIAHLKPLFNMEVFLRYMNANAWIKEYFPNFRVFALSDNETDGRRSLLQRPAELLFTGRWADALDRRTMEWMRSVWTRRYPEFDEETRNRLFRCTPKESSAYAGNFSDRILGLYRARLAEYRLTPHHDD